VAAKPQQIAMKRPYKLMDGWVWIITILLHSWPLWMGRYVVI
jgi:hypothetical protein